MSIIAFAALRLPSWSADASRLFSLYSDADAIFADIQLLLSFSLVDSSLLAILPHQKDILRTFLSNLVH